MKKRKLGSGGIRTHASEETGALNQRLRPLGHATRHARIIICNQFAFHHQKVLVEVDFNPRKKDLGKIFIEKHCVIDKTIKVPLVMIIIIKVPYNADQIGWNWML